VDQSATPWRVFDAPSNGEDDPAAGKDTAPGKAADVSPAPARLAIAGVVGAIAIGLVAIVVAVSGSGDQLIEAPDRDLGTKNDAALLAGNGGGAGVVVVDVTGAVVKPGLYRLPTGSRVGDAIDAAGGFNPRVDADRVATALNLAETLKDGGQVHVPSRDEATASNAAGGGSGGGGGASGGSLVNINTASASELDALPGIGPVTAAKIIESRTAQPFASVGDLRERKLVGEKAFGQLQPLITVD
jgi:competence protein ComEA